MKGGGWGGNIFLSTKLREDQADDMSCLLPRPLPVNTMCSAT